MYIDTASETVSVRLRKKLNDSIYRKLRSTFASIFWYIFHRINLELGCFIFSNSYVTSFQSPYAANISPPLKNFVKNRYKNKSQQKRKTRKSLEKSIASKKKLRPLVPYLIILCQVTVTVWFFHINFLNLYFKIFTFSQK